MSFESALVKEEPLEGMEDDLEEKKGQPPPLKKVKKEGKRGGSSKKEDTSDLSAEEKRRRKAERARERKRQKRESMTPEELEEMRRKNAAKERARYAAKSPEELEAIRRKNAEKARERKQRAKEILTPEQLEEKRRRHAAQQRARMAAKKPEEMEEFRRREAERQRHRWKNRPDREEMLKKISFRNFVRRSTMTEEEREAKRQKAYLYRQAWKATKGMWRDPREVEEEKERRKKWFREWSKNLSGEKRQRHKENVKRAVRKYHEKLKAGGSTMEEPDKWRERREKYLENQRSKYANETPEERQRRRYKEKVNGARRKLRKELEGEGAGQEEIERRDEELKVKLWKMFDPEWEVPSHNRGRRVGIVKEDTCVEMDAGSSSGRISLNHVAQVGVKVDDQGFCHSDSNDWCPPPSPPSPPASPPDNEDNYFEYFEEEFGDTPSKEGDGDAPVVVVTSHQCPHCVLLFSFSTDVRGHIRSSHPAKCYKCPKCGELMTSPQELSEHYQAKHKKTETSTVPNVTPHPPPVFQLNFFCMPCCVPPTPPSDLSHPHHLTGFKSRSELLGHVKVSHPDHYWPCDHCHLLKYSERALQLHLSLCRRNPDACHRGTTEEKRKGKSGR